MKPYSTRKQVGEKKKEKKIEVRSNVRFSLKCLLFQILLAFILWTHLIVLVRYILWWDEYNDNCNVIYELISYFSNKLMIFITGICNLIVHLDCTFRFLCIYVYCCTSSFHHSRFWWFLFFLCKSTTLTLSHSAFSNVVQWSIRDFIIPILGCIEFNFLVYSSYWLCYEWYKYSLQLGVYLYIDERINF